MERFLRLCNVNEALVAAANRFSVPSPRGPKGAARRVRGPRFAVMTWTGALEGVLLAVGQKESVNALVAVLSAQPKSEKCET